MKPTEKQLKVIDSVLSIIKTWKNTNDITSPTHHSDCYDFLRSDLMDDLDDEAIDEIHNKTMDLWFLINNIKD